MFRYNCYLCDFDLCSECINILLKDKELEVKVRVVSTNLAEFCIEEN